VTGGAWLMAIALAGGAGQAARGPEDRPRPVQPRAPGDEAFKMIDAYVLSNLEESLQLTDEQFVKLMPLVKRLQTDRRAMIMRRTQSLVELRRLLASGGATEPRVTELLGQVKAAEAEEPSVLRKDREAVDGALSPVQQAKFRVLEMEVEHRIRELMNQIRAQRRGNGARRPDERNPEP
jgi:hypothetical protein